MTFPTLASSDFLLTEIALPISPDDALYLGTAGYDFGNHLSFGSLDEERYNAQVTASGEELYNTAINLGASNESIASGVGLGQALAGNVVGTNALAGAITGYDLGTNQMLTGMERLQEAAQGVSQVAGTLAGGLAISRGGSLGSQCFTEGTQVVVGEIYDDELCTTVYVTENIEDIEVGDLVYSYDTVTGQVVQSEVTETFVRESDHINYLTIEDSNGNLQVIETTDEHPLWVVTESGGGWIEAKHLQIGDQFLDADGDLSTLISTERQEENVTVYNFEVVGNHNYFVIAEGEYGQTCILVHNTCGNEFRPRTRDSRPDNMKPGHIRDNPTMDAIQNRHNLTDGQRSRMHELMAEMKDKGETLKWSVLDDLARRVKKEFPNL